MNDTEPRKVEHHRRGTASTAGNLQAVCVGLPRCESTTVINDKNRSTETNRATVLFKGGEMFQVNRPFYI